jgi:hypothetical protein
MSTNKTSYVKKHTGARVCTLFQFQNPVSPHIAAREVAETDPTSIVRGVVKAFETLLTTAAERP